MKNNLQSLREDQSRVDLSELEKSNYISIDRLTVILDSDNYSLRRILWELRNSINSIIQEFSIQENLKGVKTTLSIYSHLYPNADTKLTDKLNLISNDFID
jgi:replication protein